MKRIAPRLLIALVLVAALSQAGGARPAAAALSLPQATCTSADSASVTFQWGPQFGGLLQFIDLSTLDNDFEASTFTSVGPLPPELRTYTWDGLVPGQAYVWRVTTMTQQTWLISETGSFVPCGNPAVLAPKINCSRGNVGEVTFRWAAPTPTGTVQFLDISGLSATFEPGTFGGLGPLPSAQQTFVWQGARPNVRFFYRITTLMPGGWALSDIKSFLATCNPGAVTAQAAPGLACSGERWPVKTLSDKDAPQVNPLPIATSITALRDLQKPATLPTDRRALPTELITYVLNGQVVEFRVDESRDVYVIIATPGKPQETMLLKFPDPNCDGTVASSQRASMASARDAFIAACGAPSPTLKTCAAEIQFTGVGFFDSVAGQRGDAPNGIQLHPVVGVTVVSRGATPAAAGTALASSSGAAGPPVNCTSFTSAAAQSWCRLPAGDVLSCNDFPTQSEASRFTLTVDPLDVNMLDLNHDYHSCGILPP